MAFRDQRVFQSDVRETSRDVRHAFGDVAAFIDNPIASVKFSPEVDTLSPRTVTITVRDRLDVPWRARWVLLVCISSSEYSSSNTQGVAMLTGNLVMQSANKETLTIITQADGTCSFEIYSPSTTRYVTCTVLGRAQTTAVTLTSEDIPRPAPDSIGYYGVFTDTTDQTIGNATPTAITYNTTEEAAGVSIGSPTSRVVCANAGVYNFQFSAQLRHSAGGSEVVSIWFRKNGSDVVRSNTEYEIAGNNAGYVAAWNFVATMAAGDYFEIMMSATDTDVRLDYEAAQTSPTRPVTPSIILTVTQVVFQSIGGIGGGGGSSTFIGLTDVPSTYSGQANKYVAVNGAETALEFVTGSGVISNLDGGHPDTNYGGITAIDCGGVV